MLSSKIGEGKSITAFQLAIVFSQIDRLVLLIDAQNHIDMLILNISAAELFTDSVILATIVDDIVLITQSGYAKEMS